MEQSSEWTSIHLRANILETISRSNTQYALLIGRFDLSNGCVYVFNGICIEEPISCQSLASMKLQLEDYLPAGLCVVGLWKPDPGCTVEDTLQWADTNLLVNTIEDDDRLIVLTAPFENVDDLTQTPACMLMRYQNSLRIDATLFVNILRQNEDEPFYRNTLSIRADFSLSLELQIAQSSNSDDLKHELADAFDKLACRFVDRNEANDENSSTNKLFSNVFKTTKGKVLLTDDMTNGFKLDGNLSIEKSNAFDLWKQLNNQDDRKFKKKTLTFNQDFIDFNLLQNITMNKNDEDSVKYVPIIHYEAAEFTFCSIPIRLKPLVVCSQSTKLKYLPSLLNEAITRQIRCAQACIMKFSGFDKDTEIVVPEPFLFYPNNVKHFVTLFLPKNITEDQLASYRNDICRLWNFRTDRPVIRRSNTYCFPEDSGVYLRNVHEFASPSSISGGIRALVDGDYEYHHYMQDNFDDKGWGCAYRSFQTVWSWFLLQGYTEKPVPNHTEIQQALIDIGDRPAKFLGTKQWIGSLELSYCLSHLINIESKIMNVSSGSELTSKIRELISHFETEGTPIMIGGGVLAHTILGVHFSEETGEIKYLVLDPHYTSEENVKTIVDKGWCGWKASDFWSDGAFYNLLLPQRPRGVA